MVLDYCSRNQAQAMLLLHLPMCQHQLLLSLLILILLLLPTHLIPLQILTIQLHHTHRCHPQPHTHRLPQLTHHIPHIHLPIHSPHTLHHLPIHPPPILLPTPIPLLLLFHHLPIHRLQVILLVTNYFSSPNSSPLLCFFCNHLFFSMYSCHVFSATS